MKNNMKIKAHLYDRVAQLIEEEMGFISDRKESMESYLAQTTDENTGKIDTSTWEYKMAQDLELRNEASERLIAYLEKI